MRKPKVAFTLLPNLVPLLDSGVPILTAVGIVKTVVGNDVIAEAIAAAGVNIAEGQSIAKP